MVRLLNQEEEIDTMDNNTISNITQEQEEKLHELGAAYVRADITRIIAQRETEHIMSQMLEILRTPEGATWTDADLHITVIYVPEIVKTITDIPRIKAEHPELWDQYTKDSIVRERVQVQANG